MSDKLIFIDTSGWIEYLKKTPHLINKTIETALNLNIAATSKLVFAELLQGARTEKEIELIQDLASVVKILKEQDNTWQKAGLLANKLRKNGNILPLIDCYLAVLAKENNAEVLSLDKHFLVISKFA